MFINKFRALTKATTVFLAIITYFALGFVFWLIFRDPTVRRRKLVTLVQKYAQLGLWILGFKVHYEWGDFDPHAGRNYFVVCNHLSYLDVLVIAAQFPSVFVTSREIQETPFLGWITDLGGCAYVERRNKLKLPQEIVEIADIIRSGVNVVIFPEATSTSGEMILPFKRPLFACAIKAKVPVLPLCINYTHIDSQPVTAANHKGVCWYGDMSFAPHLLEVCAHKRVDVKLTFLPTIPAPEDSDVTDLAQQSRESIVAHYRPLI